MAREPLRGRRGTRRRRGGAKTAGELRATGRRHGLPLCYRCAAPAAAFFLVVIIVQSAVMMNTFDRLSALEAAVGDKGAAAPPVLQTAPPWQSGGRPM
eukprot:COSAG04_NODE_299_length_17462_cov_3.686057_9_plen_98_part_00